MKHTAKYIGLAVAACFLAGGVFGATYVEETDYSVGWDADAVPSGGPDSEEGTVTFNTGDVGITAGLDSLGATDAIYAGAGSSLLNGNQNLTTYDFGLAVAHVVSATFNFYSDSGGVNDSPAFLALYFANGSTYWRYTVYTSGDPNLTGWTPFSVAMDGGAGWTSSGTDSFEATLAFVTEIGIQVEYTGEGSQVYGLDNFALHYPEPGTYAVLAFALMSLGVTFRGKLRTGLKGLIKK